MDDTTARTLIARYNKAQTNLRVNNLKAISGDRGWFYIVRDSAVERRVREKDFLNLIEELERRYEESEEVKARTKHVTVGFEVVYETNLYVPEGQTLEEVREEWAETIRSKYGREMDSYLTVFSRV